MIRIRQPTQPVAKFIDPRRAAQDWNRSLQNRGAASVPQVEPAFGGQFAIRFGNRAEVNAQFEGEPSHGGKLCARLEGSIDQQDAQIVGDLPYGGDVGLRVEANSRGRLHTCLVYRNSIQFVKTLPSRRAQGSSPHSPTYVVRNTNCLI